MGPSHNILSACNKTENVHFLCLQLVRFSNPHYVVSWRIWRACSQLCSFPIALLPSAADCNKTRSQLTQLGHMIELPHVSHLHFQTDCMLSHKISSTQLYLISSFQGADLWVLHATLLFDCFFAPRLNSICFASLPSLLCVLWSTQHIELWRWPLISSASPYTFD